MKQYQDLLKYIKENGVEKKTELGQEQLVFLVIK